MSSKTSKKPAKKAAQAPRKRGSKLTFQNVGEMQAFLANQTVKDSDYRLVSKPVAAPAPDEEPEAARANPSEGEWGPKPSRRHQMRDMPTTVRNKASTTRQFILSNPEHLDEWNRVQARLHPPDCPELILQTYESQFSPSLGSFVLHVSFAELEYQQLL